MIKNYSVVIRTLGTAGEKYDKLLKSIDSQTIKPNEIIVVIPHGYKVDHALGSEKIINSQKGMVIQRITGIRAATSEFILVVDDDVIFNEFFASDMLNCIEKLEADAVLPKLTNHEASVSVSLKFKIFTELKSIRDMLIGQRFKHRSDDFMFKIASTGGHSIKDNCDPNKYYRCQSGNFQCFFMKTQKAKDLHFEDELWLDETKYSMYDDQVFFYKSYLKGYKLIFAPQITYYHLEGYTGQNGDENSDKLKSKLYINTRNRTIFWYKFLYSKTHFLTRKIWLIVSLSFSLLNMFIIYSLYCIFIPKFWSVPFSIFSGLKNALRYMDNIKLKKMN